MHWVSLALLALSPLSTTDALLVPQQQLKTPLTRYRRFCRHCSSSTTLPLGALSTDQHDDDDEGVQVVTTAAVLPSVPILPAREPLPSFFGNGEDEDDFSILSWNILLPNSHDNWWCHKQYAATVAMDKRQWKHRQSLIQERLVQSAADIVCIQEADGTTFEEDFRFMKDAGYDYVLHKKYRFRCATFFKREKFVLEKVSHKDRTLVTTLRCTTTSTTTSTSSTSTPTPHRLLHLVNCHLSGGAAPERRLRQVHDGLDQIRKYINSLERTVAQQRRAKFPSPKGIAHAERDLHEYTPPNAGIIVCGDFNSHGNTAVRKLLVEGHVDPAWYEPRYPNVRLTTSKRREHMFGTFVDAYELAYGGNVCDGDYCSGEEGDDDVQSWSENVRPATYVVPNLASLLLLPIVSSSAEHGGRNNNNDDPPRTQFGMQIARGFADTLNLKDFCEVELDTAFGLVDNDDNDKIDAGEIVTLLEKVYVATYGQQIEQERNNFFRGFGGGGNKNQGNNDEEGGLTKEQFVTRLKALKQDSEGERKAFGLARGLNLRQLSESEMEEAFERIDLDGNGLLDEEEFQILLETVYVTIYGEDIAKQRSEFFVGFQGTAGTGTGSTETNNPDDDELTKEQFIERLLALHQELEGGRKGAELAEVRTDADLHKMIERFTPLLQRALDEVFDTLSSNGHTLTQTEVDTFLIKTNGELGRGGTFRHTSTLFEKKSGSESLRRDNNEPSELTRRDWYGVFARELAEGKWWSVVYDLEVCGSSVRSADRSTNSSKNKHGGGGGGDDQLLLYQGWLDYIYYQSLACIGVQDVLTDAERTRVYSDGDALPNEWHPSDHLPSAAIFSWK